MGTEVLSNLSKKTYKQVRLMPVISWKATLVIYLFGILLAKALIK